MSPIESERLQGFPDNWTLPEGQLNTDENIDTLRYTAIGNAVTVPVVKWIAKKVYEELANTDEERDLEILENYHDFKNTKWDERTISKINDKFIESNAFPTPSKIINSSLLKLIEPNQNRSLYYLTPNAAEGILRRVDHQGRTLFTPLRIALEQLKSQNND